MVVVVWGVGVVGWWGREDRTEAEPRGELLGMGRQLTFHLGL